MNICGIGLGCLILALGALLAYLGMAALMEMTLGGDFGAKPRHHWNRWETKKHKVFFWIPCDIIIENMIKYLIMRYANEDTIFELLKLPWQLWNAGLEHGHHVRDDLVISG